MTRDRPEDSLPNGQVLAGIDLEPEFWDLLHQIGALEGTPINIMVQKIDLMRGVHPCASAIRVFILKYFQSRSTVLSAINIQGHHKKQPTKSLASG